MVLIMRPSSTSKFQFAFGFNEIFSLLHFEKFLVLYLGCGYIFMTFDFTTQVTSSELLPHANEYWVQRPPNIYHEMLSQKKFIFWLTFSATYAMV